jgi:hypothetical protein
MNKKTKEKVLTIINDVIIEKLSELMENMSDNEFVEEVGVRVYHELKYDILENDEDEELQDLIGSRVVPLLQKILEYSVSKEISTK